MVYTIASLLPCLPAIAGLTADGRVLIDKARVECQSHRLTVEDPVTVEYITRHIAGIQQVFILVFLYSRNLKSCMFAAIHPIGRCSTFRNIYPHRWIRSIRHQTPPLPNRAQWYLQRLEGAFSFPPLAFIHLYIGQLTQLYRSVQANAIGRSSKTVREFLEKNHRDDLTREEAIKLTVKSLLEVVQTGAKNIEISVMESYGKITVSAASTSRRCCAE